MLEVGDKVTSRTYGAATIVAIISALPDGRELLCYRLELFSSGGRKTATYVDVSAKDIISPKPKAVLVLKLGYVEGSVFKHFDERRPVPVETHEAWLNYIKEKYDGEGI